MLRAALLWPVKVGAITVALWYFLRDPFPYPADWIVSIVAAILLHMSYAATSTAIGRRRDLRLLAKAGEPAADGVRVALVGTLRPKGEPLRAPISGSPCVGYTYEMFHYVSTRSQSGSYDTKRKQVDFTGIALADCVLHTAQGDVPMLSYPFVAGFPTQRFEGGEEAARAQSYIEQTVFEQAAPYVGVLAAYSKVMGASQGALKRDWRVSSASDVSTLTLEEQIMRPDQKVCAFGIWSDAKHTILPDRKANALGVLFIQGDAEQAARQMSSSQSSSWTGGVVCFAIPAVAIGFLLFAPWRVLKAVPGTAAIIDKQTERLKDALSDNNLHEIAAALRYLDPNTAFEEASRTPLMLVKSPEAAQILLARGASVTAHDSNGYSVLMNAAEQATPETIRFLVAHGADINERLKTNPATTALSIARDRNATDVVAALVAAGARE